MTQRIQTAATTCGIGALLAWMGFIAFIQLFAPNLPERMGWNNRAYVPPSYEKTIDDEDEGEPLPDGCLDLGDGIFVCDIPMKKTNDPATKPQTAWDIR